MNSRERVLKALDHEEPDRVPIDIGGYISTVRTIKAYENLKKYLGFPEGNFKIFHAEHMVVDDFVVKRLHADTQYVRPRPLKDRYKRYPGKIVEDEWGIKFHKSENSLYYELHESPLKEPYEEVIEEYEWPDPKDPIRYEGLEDEARGLYEETDYCIILDHLTPLFGEGLLEKAWYLRGFQEFLKDMIIRPDFVETLLKKLHQIQMTHFGEVLDRVGDYVQIAEVMSDFGMHDRMIFSPDFYRKFFKPFDAKLIEFIKKKAHVKVLYHTCGSLYPIIPDYIENGVDVLNPVQPRAKDMESSKLKKEFGESLSFHGGFDIQQILPYGSIDEVDEEAKRVIRELGHEGGYIFAPAHCIQPDVPPENIVAMYDSAFKHGKYPISL
jgi:uroporphyrinogen decarboxylase